MTHILYSVVIPLKNEEDNIVDLIEELEPVMVALKKPWEAYLHRRRFYR